MTRTERSRPSPATATTSCSEVEDEVEEGDWVKMCMQCGVCAGSCPFGPHWEHSPQKIFMMIRAGKRDEVLTLRLDVDVHVLLQLRRALPAQAADHAHHARARELRAPARARAEDAADARLLAACSGTTAPRPAASTSSSSRSALYFKDGLVAGIKKALDACSDVGAGPAEGQAPESVGALRRARLQGPEGHRRRMLKKARRDRGPTARDQRQSQQRRAGSVCHRRMTTWRRRNTRSTPAARRSCKASAVELPDVGQLDVQDARRQADADPGLELLRRVDRLRRRRASCRGT